MTRRVRRDVAFGAAVRETAQWLVSHRSVEDIERLRRELERVETRLGSYPRLGREVEVRHGWSVRVIRLGALPYLIWYSFDASDPRGPIWLLLLMHEKQDRDEFLRAAARRVLERSGW